MQGLYLVDGWNVWRQAAMDTKDFVASHLRAAPKVEKEGARVRQRLWFVDDGKGAQATWAWACVRTAAMLK